jgi:hypothetical protein
MVRGVTTVILATLALLLALALVALALQAWGARREGTPGLVVPLANLTEVSFVTELDVRGADALTGVLAFLIGRGDLARSGAAREVAFQSCEVGLAGALRGPRTGAREASPPGNSPPERAVHPEGCRSEGCR